jgi:N-acetylmuramoyl-L-alanine amidase
LPKKIKIAQGDSVIKLSDRHGFFADTIWEDNANLSLKENRKDMNSLQPGDVLVIPDKRVKSIEVESDSRHRFRRCGIPAKFQLQLLKNGEPRASEDYRFIIDGKILHGKTDSTGSLEEYISASSEEGVLYIGPMNTRIHVKFGHMDPIEEMSGVQKRLRNLGFSPGCCDGKHDDRTRSAIMVFQKQFGLSETGEIDESTRAKLAAVHDESESLRPNPGNGQGVN